VEEVRGCGRPIAGFTPVMLGALAPLRACLMRTMYTHPSVKRIRAPAEQVVEELFHALHDTPSELPERWRDLFAAADEPWGGRIIGDYVAGMTDRFAIREHRRLTGRTIMPDESFF
jgi:dGTPase